VTVVDRHPLLIQADTWAQENAELLEACFRRFQMDGEWPRVEQLQHDFEVANHAVDVWQHASRIPRALGFIEQERLVLRVRTLSYVPAARPLLRDWWLTLRAAYEQWRRDPSAHFSRADVWRLLDEDTARTRAASALLLRESWPFGSGQGGPDDDWWRELHSGVRAARGAEDPQDIIAARDAIEFPPAAVQVEPEPEQQPAEPAGKRLVRILGFASNNPLAATAIGTVLATMVLAILGGAAKLIVDAAHSKPGPPAPTVAPQTTAPQTHRTSSTGERREQAGTAGARSFADPHGLSGEGGSVKPGEWVTVRCKVYAPAPPSVVPDGYWYLLSSPPWNGKYYAPANSFWNGDKPGHTPYTHNTDFSVPNC
jgi:hypothetical protein